MRNSRAKLLKTMVSLGDKRAYRAIKKAYTAMPRKQRATMKIPNHA